MQIQQRSLFVQFSVFRYLCGAILISFLSSALAAPTALALESTFDTGSDWGAGTLTSVTTTDGEGQVQLAADGTWGAQAWRSPDFQLSLGTTFASDGTDIYVIRGVGDVAFWKYAPGSDSWAELADLPRGTYSGADITVLDDSVYALFGGYQKAFARYDAPTNTWTELADFPDLTHSGASLATDGTDLYALRGNNTQEFFKYSVESNTWTALAGMPATARGGADLVFADGYLYTLRGNNSRTFYRYSIADNSWTTLANYPTNISDEVDIAILEGRIYVPRQGNSNAFYSYSIATDTWSTETSLPGLARYAGVVSHSGDNLIYVFQGNGQYNFWKYDPQTATFLGPPDAPAGVTTGSDVLHVGGVLYVLRGGNTTTLYQYDLSTGVWSTRASAPASFNDDTKGVAANGNLYFFRASNTTTFYRYSPGSNTWTTLAAAPATVRFGAALAYPGVGDYLYATRGNTSSSIWRYSISGDSWDDAGASDLPTDAESSYGSRLVATESDLYYVPGIGISRLLKYSIATDTWTELAAPPFSPYYGTDLSLANGKILALAGWYKTDVWEYSIAENQWRKLPSLAGYLPQDLGPYAGASIEFDGSNSFYVTRGNNRPNLLTYTPGSGNYLSSGSWTSDPRNLGYVTSWTGFLATASTPDDSSIVFQTRSSADGSTWSDWANVSNGTVSSPPNSYLQVKATFLPSTGAERTPVLGALTVSYTGDTTAPENPSALVALSQEVGGTQLQTENSYSHTAPYFSWSGASDNHSSIAGYYVYFGVNQVASPHTSGEFQEASTYTTTKPLSTGTYYLRIQTQDAAGNLSAPATLFTYDYRGVSPPQSLLVSDSAGFSGDASQVSIENDAISLANRTGGFWVQEALTSPPGSLQYGAKTVAYDQSDQKLYVLRGNNSKTFYSYDLNTDAWSTLANTPENVRMGGGVIEGPAGYLFGMRGNNTTDFWRYDIATDTWSDEDAADTPLTVHYGGSMVFDGEAHIYTLRGNNDDAFWRYDTLSDSWENLANTDFGATANAVNNNAYISADLAMDRENELVYAIQGNYLDGFSVYDVNTNSWEVLPDLPALPYHGASIEFVAEEGAVYFTRGNSTNRMFKYTVAEEKWEAVSASPTFFNYGGNIRNVGSYLYAIQGSNSTGFFKYDMSKDSWMTANRGLFGRDFLGTSYLNQGNGADIVQGDGSNLYIARGNYSNDFVRWNSETGVTTRMASLPSGAYTGSSLVYDSTENKIYYTGGVYLRRFFAYDIASNSWSEIASDPYPADVNSGSSMMYDGARYIYLTRGGGSNSFYRYDTQGTPGSRWTNLANTPTGLSSGAELTLHDGYIYTLRGQNAANNPFFRYEIATDTWSDLAVADLSIDVNNDGFLANGGNGKFYAARGENDTDFF